MYRVVGEGKTWLESQPDVFSELEETPPVPTGFGLPRKGPAYQKAQLKKLRKRLKERYRCYQETKENNK